MPYTPPVNAGSLALTLRLIIEQLRSRQGSVPPESKNASPRGPPESAGASPRVPLGLSPSPAVVSQDALAPVVLAPAPIHSSYDASDSESDSGIEFKTPRQSASRREALATAPRTPHHSAPLHEALAREPAPPRSGASPLRRVTADFLPPTPPQAPPLGLMEILRFPTELSNAYSYTRVLQNLLALRLNVLKTLLQIMADRPELAAATSSRYVSPATTPPRRPSQASLVRPPLMKSLLAVRHNALSVALSALMRPAQLSVRHNALSVALSALMRPAAMSNSNNTALQFDSKEMREVIRLLDQADILIPAAAPATIHRPPSGEQLVQSLHDLLLSRVDDAPARERALRARLLHALAQPFVDGGVAGETPSAIPRPFHTLLLNKSASPQAVFTCDVNSPWGLRAANDLGCLMFGVSRTVLHALTLMDLIAPQLRSLVLDRLTEDESIGLADDRKAGHTLFAGEIVAVLRSDGIAWASLWGKRKGDMLVLMFDQIPCQALDVTVEAGENGYAIQLVQKKSGSIVPAEWEGQEVAKLSPSLAAALASADPSESVNSTRYFTLNLPIPIPIACTLALQGEDADSPIKLKMHAMPYIAGMVVVLTLDYTVLLYNAAITKNLFGQGNLLDHSIDEVLPGFTKRLVAAVEPKVLHTPGVVLPEHFFRQVYAQYGEQNAEAAEEKFLASHGIPGKHRDGSLLTVDIQVRVSTRETIVLWVTYSRDDQIDARPSLQQEEDCTGVPLQLPLFHEDELMSTGLPSGLSRLSSVRTPPSDRRGSSSGENSIRMPQRMMRLSGDGPASTPNTLSSDGPESLPFDVFSPEKCSVEELRRQFDPKRLLAAEEREIDKLRALPLWPEKIGARRRTKKFSEFKTIKDMGAGAYGRVVLAEHCEAPAYKVIIKCIDKERILVDTWVRDRRLGTIPSEIQIMSFLMAEPHPNITRIVDFFEDAQSYYLETPVHGSPAGIDLFDFIELRKDMPEVECKVIFRQVLSAVAYCHRHGVVHRDIKDENIIIDEHGVIKLIDFGLLAYTRQGPFNVFVGTIEYAAPEVLLGKPYEGKPQDVWLLGVLLYTLVYKENPFYNVDEIMEGALRFPSGGGACNALIERMLVREISARPDMELVEADPWLVL